MFIIILKTTLFSRAEFGRGYVFSDRVQAGKMLAEKLSDFRGKGGAIVLGIPRGGVVVAAEISKYLNLPLSLMVVRKIGAPNNPELAIGAVGVDGTPYVDEKIVHSTGASAEYIEAETERQHAEVKRRMKEFGIRHHKLAGKTIILVDDGIATGSTVIAGVRILRNQKVAKIILAIPVCSIDSAEELKPLVDDIICLEIPPFFSAVGQFYAHFGQVSDLEVRAILSGAKGTAPV